MRQLRFILREKRNHLQKAERIKKARKERSRKRSTFVANPYKFTKTTLEGTKAGTLQSSKEEVEQHLSETHSDENQWEDLGHCDRIEKVPEPVIPMDTKEPTRKEIVDIVKKSRSASTPRQNGIPYKVYNKCPRILKHLWRLLKVVWRKGKIPSYREQVEGCFIPKEEKSENITQFRTISLLNVEGKYFSQYCQDE